MRIGFIGLGTMGSGMALNVLKGGHVLVVHDLNRDAVGLHLEAGAAWADTPQQAVEVGREFEVPMRLAHLTLAELTEALTRGWGQRDSRVAIGASARVSDKVLWRELSTDSPHLLVMTVFGQAP
jgi:hypothetical protein